MIMQKAARSNNAEAAIVLLFTPPPLGKQDATMTDRMPIPAVILQSMVSFFIFIEVLP